MKKILLTLIAVATVFVACDKDALDQDVTNINVLEQAEEINASIDVDFDAAFDFIGSVEAPKSSSNVTSKVGATGTEWIHVIFFDYNNQNLALLRGDGAEEACWRGLSDFAHSSLYTWDTASDDLTVEVEMIDGTTRSVTRPQSVEAAARFDRLFSSDALNRVRVTNSRRSGTITGTPPAITDLDFGCIPTLEGNAYRLERAPFPLDGWLATINSSFDFLTHGLDANADNYAGTSEEAVKMAIENDINN